MQNKFEKILSILKFCARKDARTYAQARVFWTEIDRTDNDLDHDKYKLEMTFGYKDMIMSWFLQNGA